MVVEGCSARLELAIKNSTIPLDRMTSAILNTGHRPPADVDEINDAASGEPIGDVATAPPVIIPAASGERRAKSATPSRDADNAHHHSGRRYQHRGRHARTGTEGNALIVNQAQRERAETNGAIRQRRGRPYFDATSIARLARTTMRNMSRRRDRPSSKRLVEGMVALGWFFDDLARSITRSPEATLVVLG